MIDRREQVGAKQFRQFAGIDLVTLVAGLEQCILARVTDHDLSYVLHQQIVKPSGLRSFFEGYMQGSTQAVEEVENGSGMGGQDRLHDQLAFGIQHQPRWSTGEHPCRYT